jgi:hypothetical protein
MADAALSESIGAAAMRPGFWQLCVLRVPASAKLGGA